MSRKQASRSGDGTPGSSGPPPGSPGAKPGVAGEQSAAPRPAGSTRSTLPSPTPHRPVVFLALVIFVPALWLVLDGNLSVQTALFRFIGALLVSWVAGWLVFATLSSYARSASPSPAQVASEAGSAGASQAD